MSSRMICVVFRYALAVACVTMAIGVGVLARSFGVEKIELPLLLMAVAIAVWNGGLVPGLLAVVVAAIGFDYFFTEPLYTFEIVPSHRPLFLTFVLFTLVIAAFTERRRRIEVTGVLTLRDLRESERRLEEAQQISHVGYWELDLATNQITWSNETYRLYGLEPQQDTFIPGARDRRHPADVERQKTAWAQALRGGPRYDIEYRIIRPGGEVRFVHSRGDVLWDATGQPRRMFGTLQDITERKLAEQRLLAQHTVTEILAAAATLEEATPKTLQAVCECLVWDVGALWRVDREAGVLRCVEVWHTAAVDIPQFEAASRQSTFVPGIGLPGRVWFRQEPLYVPDVVRDPEFPRAPIAAREILHAAFGVPILLGREVLGVMEFFSNEIRQPDQDLLDMMAVIGSQVGQFIERKRAEEALARARAELAHVARVATLGEISASIAHELNQPLAAIVNNASACLGLLEPGRADVEDLREALRDIVSDGSRASAIIEGIRRLARRSTPREEPLRPATVVDDVVALAAPESRSRRVTIRTDVPADLPVVMGDRVQLQQVLLNLVVNAMDAMSDVSDSECCLEIRACRDDDAGRPAVRISVADRGTGLRGDEGERLFQAFYTTKPHGIGLGLAISRSIVESHGGRLWAEAHQGPGATFSFRLRAASAPATA